MSMSQSRKNTILAAAVIGGAAIGLGVYTLSRAAAAAKGWLEVHAMFDGAEVSASGRVVGTSAAFSATPVWVELTRGQYTVEVIYQGVTKAFTVQVEPDATRQIYAQFTSGALPGVFSLSVSNLNPVVVRGQSADVLVTVSYLSGDNKETSLAATGVPGGQAVFSQPSGLPTFASWLTITTGVGTPIGVQTIIISATSPDRQETATLSLTVEAATDGGGTGAVRVEAYYQSLADPLAVSFSIDPIGLTGTTPTTVTGVSPGSYVVTASYGLETLQLPVTVEANKTATVRFIFGAGGPA